MARSANDAPAVRVTVEGADGLVRVTAGRDGAHPAAIALRSWHDVRNSQLDQVLARRLGLPITLSVVELEVGWRLGLRLQGIGLPGHFIIRSPSGTLIDPADGGRALTPDDCQALLRRSLGERRSDDGIEGARRHGALL